MESIRFLGYLDIHLLLNVPDTLFFDEIRDIKEEKEVK